MKFNIISINDDRKVYKDTIRKYVPFDELHMRAFNAHEHNPLRGLAARGLVLSGWDNAKLGELGVWLSNFDRWARVAEMDEPLIVFEDDAAVDDSFASKLRQLIKDVPNDWDFLSLWVPDNQLNDYYYDVSFDETGFPTVHGWKTAEESLFRLDNGGSGALVYQGYGMVSLVYSPQGGQKLVELARETGLTGPVDCWIYEQAHRGKLKGYAPRPLYATIVGYDWSQPSHVQDTERAT